LSESIQVRRQEKTTGRLLQFPRMFGAAAGL
jgi:hypothetical protein